MEAPSWRSLLLALCLLPVALPLLLCVAVAAARFRRRRRKLVAAAGMRGGCRVASSGGGRRAPEAAEEGEGQHRAELLRKYLQDQMELVGAGAGVGGRGQSHPQQ